MILLSDQNKVLVGIYWVFSKNLTFLRGGSTIYQGYHKMGYSRLQPSVCLVRCLGRMYRKEIERIVGTLSKNKWNSLKVFKEFLQKETIFSLKGSLAALHTIVSHVKSASNCYSLFYLQIAHLGRLIYMSELALLAKHLNFFLSAKLL